MNSTPLPDYYKTLSVSPSATTAEIKDAYRKESLRSHPDRFPHATPSERERYTVRFQTLADSYYILSDPGRRAEYDAQRKMHSSYSSSSSSTGTADWSSFFGPDGDPEKEQQSSANFFHNFFRHAGAPAFGGAAGAAGGAHKHEHAGANTAADGAQPSADGVFGDVFEELLRPEVRRIAPIWTWVGLASGASLGFILGNIPGAIGGAVVGNRLGAIRDAKGKSVAEVFIKLGAHQKAEVLRALAMKVLGSMGSN